jgi:hypothetical protein
VLRCAVLCCALVLCCAVLSYAAVPCCAVLSRAVTCCAVPCHAVLSLARPTWSPNWPHAVCCPPNPPLKVANAWVWTIDRRMGLFSVCSDWNDEAALQGLACHHRWLAYLAELWVVSSDRCDETAVALSQVRSRGCYLPVTVISC